MRTHSWLLIAVFAGLVSVPVWADLAPLPGSRPRPRPPVFPPVVRPQPPLPTPLVTPRPEPARPDAEVDWQYPVLDAQTQVVLASADVRVQLKPAGAKPRPAVLADVTGTFQLQCVQTPKPTVTFVTGFPLHDSDEFRAEVAQFSVEVAGKKPVWLRTERWEPDDPRSRGLTYSGYIWPLTLKAGETQEVKVIYSLRLPVQQNSAAFTYILRSGAAWSGPIGRELVRIQAVDGLRVQPAAARTLRPQQQPDGSWVWAFENAEPREDVHVTITGAGADLLGARR